MSQSPATFSRFLGHKQLTIKAIAVPGVPKTERGIAVNWKAPDTSTLLKSHFSDMAKAKV